MPAPRDSDLAVFTYHRHSIVYAGVTAALAGTAVDYNRLPITSSATAVFGVLENDAAPGETVSIAVAGICQMISGGSIPLGQPLSIDVFGRAAVGTPGQQLFGRSLSATTAVGQKVQVLITREGTN